MISLFRCKNLNKIRVKKSDKSQRTEYQQPDYSSCKNTRKRIKQLLMKKVKETEDERK